MRFARLVSVIFLLQALQLLFPSLSSAAAVLELYGTFNAMGVIVTLTGGEDPDQDAVAALSYRPAGTGEYRQGFPLSRVAGDRFVGSLFWLSPGISYDVRVTFTDPDGAPLSGATLNSTASTRAEITIPSPAISYYVSPSGSGTACTLASPCPLTTAISQAQAGQEVVLRGGVYDEGELSLPRSGTAGAPIVIRSYQGETAVLDGADPATFTWTAQGGGVYRATVNAGDTHLVMADGMRLYPYQTLADLQGLAWGIPGFYASGTSVYVRLAGDADPKNHTMLVSRYNKAITIEQSFILIKNLTLRHYGLGDYAKALYFNNASDNMVEGCTFQVNDLGIGLKRDSHRNVFQDNEFFDTDFDWPWDAVKSGSALETGGIRMYDPMTGRGTVIRRNTFHDYFDGFGVCPDDTAGVTNETDVYENLVYNAGDDGMETDGRCSNVRIWGNIFHDVLVGISVAPVYTGPVYAIRNLVYRTGAGNNDYPGSPFKFNSGYDQSGPIFLFHNTADAVLPGSSGIDIKSPGSWEIIYSRNNIWSGTDYALSNANPGQPLNLDYDCLYTTLAGELAWWDGLPDRHLNTIEELRSVTGQEMQGINAVPGFVNPVDGNYTLNTGSQLIDKGVFIAGINDGFSGAAPDMGAFEFVSGPVNGTCGAANGGTFNTAPTSGLCSSGTPTAVTGTGPWNWNCLGINGGADTQCSAYITHFTLTVGKTGDGNGSVTPDSASLTWVGSMGTGSWSYNSQVVLTASPDSLSTFEEGWSGDCVPSGLSCTATMTADRNVSTAFSAAARAKIDDVGYSTLVEAYNAASLSTKTTIKTLDANLGENLIMDKGKAIALVGGYNADYTARTGIPTGLSGIMVGTGSLTVDGIEIR